MDERFEELASLYAFDLLEGAERSAFEQQLQQDPALRALVQELRETAAQLAHTATGGPSASLRERVLASTRSSPDSTSPKARPAPVRPLFWLGWGMAAALALVAAWQTQRALSLARELATMRELATLEQAASQLARNQLEAERLITAQQTNALRQAREEAANLAEHLSRERAHAANQIAELQQRHNLAHLHIAHLTSTTPASAIAIWNPEIQQGIFTVEKLPPLGHDQDYQLWAIDGSNSPVDAGTFTVDPATGTGRLVFRPKKAVSGNSLFAVSRERKGGVPQPTHVVMTPQ